MFLKMFLEYSYKQEKKDREIIVKDGKEIDKENDDLNTLTGLKNSKAKDIDDEELEKAKELEKKDEKKIKKNFTDTYQKEV